MDNDMLPGQFNKTICGKVGYDLLKVGKQNVFQFPVPEIAG